MAACADAHHLARHLATFGRKVKLISSPFSSALFKSNKNDFVGDGAISKVAPRPSMWFVTPKKGPMLQLY